jgi:hypothetical protein
MMEDKHMMEMRVEAKRLFHIGPNLGVWSNKERFRILDIE